MLQLLELVKGLEDSYRNLYPEATEKFDFKSHRLDPSYKGALTCKDFEVRQRTGNLPPETRYYVQRLKVLGSVPPEMR